MHSLSTRVTLPLVAVIATFALSLGCSSTSDAARNTAADARSGASQESQSDSASSMRRLALNSRNGQTAGGDEAQGCQLTAVYYRYNSSQLDNQAQTTLNQNADCLRSQPDRGATLTGMADPRGTEEYNLALGERRAQTAARYMSRRGVRQGQVEVRSVGAEYASGSDESGWSRDRRSEFTH